jgi:hypothetical protein
MKPTAAQHRLLVALVPDGARLQALNSRSPEGRIVETFRLLIPGQPVRPVRRATFKALRVAGCFELIFASGSRVDYVLSAAGRAVAGEGDHA